MSENNVLEGAFMELTAAASITDEKRGEILAALGTFEGDVRHKVKIYRAGTMLDKSMKWMFDAHDHNIEGLLPYIQREYGGGQYVGRIYANGNLITQIDFGICELPTSRDILDTPVSDPDTAHKIERLERLLSEREKSRDFDIEKILTLATLALPLIERIFPQRPVAPPTPIGELRELLQLQSELAGTDEQKPEPNMFTSALAELVPVLTAGMQNSKQPPRTQRPQQRPKTESNNSELTKNMNPLMKAALKTQLKQVLEYTNDPETVPEIGDMILDHVPVTFWDQFVAFIDDKHCLAMICELVPEAEPHAAWFQRLINYIREILDEGESNGDVPRETPVDKPVIEGERDGAA